MQPLTLQAVDDVDHVYEIDADDDACGDDVTFVGHALGTTCPCSLQSPLQLKLLILCSPTVTIMHLIIYRRLHIHTHSIFLCSSID